MDHYHKHFTLLHFMRDEYHDLIISKVFRNFAISLVAIFVPIYLLQLGFSLYHIILYEIIMLTTGMCLHLLYNYLFKFIGLKKYFVFSYIVSLLYFGVLYSAEKILLITNEIIFICSIAVMIAMYGSSYWLAYHNYFVAVSHKKDAGKKFGALEGIPILTSITSPFIGAVLITAFGFQGTFVATILLLAIGAGALFFSKDIKVNPDTSIKKIIDKKNIKRNVLFSLEGLIFIPAGLCWPILLYYLGVSIKLIGFLYLISNIINAFIIMWTGKQVDKQNYSFVNLGSWGFSISLLIRGISRSIYLLTASQSLGGLSAPFWSVPMHALTYKKIKKHNRHLILTRELYLHIGRIVMLVILGILLFFIPPITVVSTGLILGAVVALLIPPFLKQLY